MSRGFGVTQQWLLWCIGTEPVTFEEISDRAYPAGTFNADLAKAIGGSNVGGIRSLRRALGQALRSWGDPDRQSPPASLLPASVLCPARGRAQSEADLITVPYP